MSAGNKRAMECMKDLFTRDQLLDGRFRTISPLNHGSFGMVFLAQDMTTQHEVAIKCLTRPGATAAADTVIADEGAEELNCHAILQRHDHLVNLVHHFESRAHTYLVLEYCSQGDLYEAIRLGRGPLETEHVRQFMLQLIGAVEHMHTHGLYHRDIKPENIFLTKDGSMKLGDFGLATKNSWSYESCVGSDRYMAPEQYDSAGNGYSPAKADIWSIGICLLNVLFARNPFVTPTESDVLFADYRRDRQSLFDIFPSMSQDTFEILSIAMALDPEKRDLAAVRRAILRAVTFTTDDEDMDEFCTNGRDVVRASANREPLRTPSIQTPQINGGDSFPWAKALQTSPHRQLSAIPDESYEEDLFPASEKGLNLGESWFSGHTHTPSLASILDSAFSASFKSMAIRRPIKNNPPRPDPIAIPNSLPVTASRPIPAMSSIFGKKKDTVAKSWSEMFEEDVEESEREQAELDKRHEKNSRTWSQESRTQVTVRPGILTETQSHSSINARQGQPQKAPPPLKSSQSPNENDPFQWRSRAKRSPTKVVDADKWAALGHKRRNYQPDAAKTPSATKRRSMTTGSRRKTPDHPPFPRRDSRDKGRPAYLNQDWRQHKTSFDSSADEGDEWVGGWNEFH